MKQISCGILLINNQNQILLGHITPTPSNRWTKNKYDIPKGCHDEEETYLETALRELKEETGLVIDKSDIENIKDIGLHSYNKTKDLYLFIFHDTQNKYLNSKCLDKLSCSSTFIDLKDGKEYYEIQGFKVFELKDLFIQANDLENSFLHKSMAFLFKNIKDEILENLTNIPALNKNKSNYKI